MKIICVDDENLVLELVVRLCEELPQINEVVSFSSSPEALEYMKNNSADLALLDIEMPKMNGIDALTEVMKYDPDANVIMCSDQKYENMIVMAIKRGAKDFVIKPFTASDVITAVNKVFAGSEEE